MTLRNVLRRTSLILGLISLALALWAGVHLQHLLDDAGNRHAGETVVAIAIALLVFSACWSGARIEASRE